MNRVSVKAFILLDVLFGVTLMVAVMLLCGYFRQMATGFYVKSAGCRTLARAYYAERGGGIELDTMLLFSQPKTNTVIQRQGVLSVVRGKGALANKCLVVSQFVNQDNG